jgi:hypothetical protein
MAEAHNDFNGIVLPLVDAKQNRFFCRAYKGGKAISPLMDANMDAVAVLLPEGEAALVTGPAAELAGQQLRALAEKPAFRGLSRLTTDVKVNWPYALDLLNFVERNPALHGGDDVFSAPIYVRPAV